MRFTSLIAAAACLAPGAFAARGEDAPSPVAAALEEFVFGDEREQARARERLFTTARNDSQEVFAVLSGELPVSSERGPLMSGESRELLFGALVAAGPDVLEELQPHVDAESPFSTKLVFVELVGRVGEAGDLARVRVALEEVEPVMLATRALSGAVTRTVHSLLERAPGTNQRLVDDYDEWSPALLPAVARGLGAHGRGESMKVLSRMFGKTLELDEAVLEALGDMRPWEIECVSGECSRTLAMRVNDAEPRVRRQALLSLGKLRERSVFPDVLAALADPDPRVAAAGEFALRELTGLPRAARADWAEWYEAEEDWYAETVPELLHVIGVEAPGPAVRAVEELSSHRIWARELVEDLTPELMNDDALIAEAVCWALVRLDHGSAVAPLVRAARQPGFAAPEAARTALERLTGQRFETFEEWSAWAVNGFGS